MKTLFIGGVFPKELEKNILEKSKGVVFYPANKHQYNIIDGLLESGKVELNILSAPFIGAYPRGYKELYFKKGVFPYKDNLSISCVSFINIWGYRNISRKNSLIRQINKFTSNKSTNKAIIVYSPHTPFIQAAAYAKKVDPSIHICLIVPDLPQYMNLNENITKIYKYLKKLDIYFFNKNLEHVDSFVLLTKHMKNMLNIGKKPYVVIEGIVNENDIRYHNCEKSNDVKSVVYTGTLNKKFGVINLVKAFYKINDPKIRLDICGKGDSEEVIREYTKIDNRIKYWGQISNEEAVALQLNSELLVNPRQNNEEFTKFSFPSKNMEYLLTGRPVVAYKLDGIPDEYDDFFYYVDNNSIDSLSKKIKEVLLITEEEKKMRGIKAREFVLKEKNSNSASEKIIDMILRCKKQMY